MILTEISADLSLIPDILEDYANKAYAAEDVFELDNKKLEHICKDHPKNLFYYKKKAYEMKSLQDLIDIKIEDLAALLYKDILSSNQRVLSPKDIQMYVQCKPELISLKEIRLEVVTVRRQFDNVVSSLEDMGWMLSHMTKLRVAELEDAVL